ncbi:enoyl-CoA hydratase-related protein [Pseudorhodobacter sp. W20_MBD10_FR17]|uniref:enoyl-CoA hydratase-related protein n=1 Tax=Pseudorhodobacter sp. W20_MBD10_FR17 TaxID=3240266 RepID=UPI003F9A8475
MTDEVVQFSKTENVARICLNRPAKLNSLTADMLQQISVTLEEVARDSTLSVVVIEANGRAFCAGQDLTERRAILDGARIDLGDALDVGLNCIVKQMAALPQAVVCAVQGGAAGAGANLAFAADIVIAAQSSWFSQPFSKLGLVPDAGGTWTIPRLVGNAKARGFMLLGEPISAQTAEGWGLIWAVVEDSQLASAISDVTSKLSLQSAIGLKLTREALLASQQNDLYAQLDLERDYQREAGFTPFYREQVRKFLSK